MILIKNGRLIDPLSKRDEIVDIAIENDKVKQIKLGGQCDMGHLVFDTNSVSKWIQGSEEKFFLKKGDDTPKSSTSACVT